MPGQNHLVTYQSGQSLVCEGRKELHELDNLMTSSGGSMSQRGPRTVDGDCGKTKRKEHRQGWVMWIVDAYRLRVVLAKENNSKATP